MISIGFPSDLSVKSQPAQAPAPSNTSGNIGEGLDATTTRRLAPGFGWKFGINPTKCGDYWLRFRVLARVLEMFASTYAA